jgi:hypothetical protein
MQPEETEISAGGERLAGRLRVPRLRWILLAGMSLVLVLWVVPVLIEAIGSVEIAIDRPYLLIFAFVTFDAVIPLSRVSRYSTSPRVSRRKTSSRSATSSSSQAQAPSSATRSCTGSPGRSRAATSPRSSSGRRRTRRSQSRSTSSVSRRRC